MALWQVRTEGEYIELGFFRRKKLNSQGCNEPFKDRFWCPKRKWFLKSPCPFINKKECDNYKRLCGAL